MTQSTKRGSSVAKNRAAINVSSRLPADRRLSPLTQALVALAPPFDLTVTNPTVVGISYPELKVTGTREYIPDAKGLPAARGFLGRELECDPEHLIITASTSEAYAIAFKTLLDPGGLVAAPRPSYPLVPHLAELEGVRVVDYVLDRDDGFRVDLTSLDEALQRGARVVVVVSPNNPTGTIVGAHDMHAVARLCARYGATLIVDRVFARYALESRDVPLPRDLPGGVIELDGLSKRCGLPQMKLAWMRVQGPPELTDALAWVSDAYLSTSGPAQAALPELWRAGADIAAAIEVRLRTNLAALTRAVATVPAITRLPVPAGWTAVLRLPCVVDDDAWVTEFARAGVRVQPGYFYDFASDGYIVLSLLPEPQVFERAIAIVMRTCEAMV